MDGDLPSTSCAPSIWYDDVAAPHTKSAGSELKASTEGVPSFSFVMSRRACDTAARLRSVRQCAGLRLCGHPPRLNSSRVVPSSDRLAGWMQPAGHGSRRVEIAVGATEDWEPFGAWLERARTSRVER